MNKIVHYIGLDVHKETIAVSIAGTTYYVAYHRNQEPYGYLSQTSDRDRLFVYSKNDFP
mgnify:CR=1 FL=1